MLIGKFPGTRIANARRADLGVRSEDGVATRHFK
jgi:hypothetical protein